MFQRQTESLLIGDFAPLYAHRYVPQTSVSKMPIVAAHVLLYSPQSDELRAVLRDIFGWEHVEDSPGWLVFKLPPSELGVHPSDGARHELSLMCDDIAATVSELRAKGIEFCDEPQERTFGIATTMVLPGGVEVLLYQPRHASPLT